MSDHIGSNKQSAPRLCCGAAIIDRSRILKRKRSPEAGHWGLFGGKIEPGEGVEDAVVRENAEELGIAIQLGRWICTVEHCDDGTGQRSIAQEYSASIISGVPRICEPRALAAVEWFAPDRLPSPLTAATVQATGALGDGRGAVEQ